MTMVQEHNATTNEVIVRPMTEEEIAQAKIDSAAFAAKEQARVEQEAARAALLDRLGITAEEAQLLLGGN